MHLNPQRQAALTLSTVCALAWGPMAMGISIRHDRLISQYETQVNTAPYDATGQANNPQSGTLIDPYWVLASAHVSIPSTFTTSDGTTVSVAQRIVYPGDASSSNAVDGADFALLRLSAPINSVTPGSLHDPIATGTSYSDLLASLTGLTAVYAGSGETGNGNTGTPASGSRDILAGTNVIDTVGYDFGDGFIANIAVSDFDDPDTTDPDTDPGTNLEMGLAGRDSGGGLWVDLGDGPVLVGVHSAVTDDGDGILGEYDQLNFSTILTDDAYNWIQATIPEPSSLALLSIGALMLGRRRRS